MVQSHDGSGLAQAPSGAPLIQKSMDVKENTGPTEDSPAVNTQPFWTLKSRAVS